jgi:carboxymethylenebutenolidase
MTVGASRECATIGRVTATPTRTESVDLDGGEMDLHIWIPPAGEGPGVLLLQEIFGVGEYIRDVAGRLADDGYVIAAPDVFWRFAPGWASGHDAADLEASFAVAQQLDAESAIADCAAALDATPRLPETTGKVAVLGFCLGGSLAWGVAAHAEPDACVSYYGSRVAATLDLIDRVSCPTLFHFCNADPYIPGSDVEAVAAAIDGRPGFTLNVENGGHAFDNHRADMFWNETAAKAAWAKTQAFLVEHLR